MQARRLLRYPDLPAHACSCIRVEWRHAGRSSKRPCSSRGPVGRRGVSARPITSHPHVQNENWRTGHFGRQLGGEAPADPFESDGKKRTPVAILTLRLSTNTPTGKRTDRGSKRGGLALARPNCGGATGDMSHHLARCLLPPAADRPSAAAKLQVAAPRAPLHCSQGGGLVAVSRRRQKLVQRQGRGRTLLR